MALAQRRIEIPLAGGIDQETADKILPLGFDLELENCQWARKGEVEKRPGGAAMAMGTTPGAGVVPPIWQLAQHRGSLVALGKAGNAGINVYSEPLAKWLLADSGGAGRLRGPVKVTTTTVASESGTDHRLPDVAYINYGAGFRGEAHVAGASVLGSVFDANNKRLYTFSATGTFPRCFSIGQWFVTTFLDGAFVRLMIWDAANPGATFTTALPASNASSLTSGLDVVSKSATVFTIVYRTTTPSMAGIDVTCTSSVSAAAPYAITTAAAGVIDPAVNIGVCQDFAASGFRVVLTCDAANGVRAHYINGSNVTTKTLTIDAAATANVFHLTGYTIDSTPHLTILYDISGTVASDPRLKMATVLGADVVTAADWLRSARVGSKPFIYNSNYYAIGTYDSATQPTGFLFRVPNDTTLLSERTPQARFSTWKYGVGGAAVPHIPAVATLATGKLLSASSFNARLTSFGGARYYELGTEFIDIEFDPVIGRPVEVGNWLLVPSGGQLNIYDGKTFAELPFCMYPEQPTLVQSDTGPGALTLLGTYTYLLVFRYSDNSGALHRSAVSFDKAITLTGTNDTVTLTIPCLGVTSWPVTIEIYRNESNKTAFYKIGTVANSVVVPTVSYIDQAADAAIISGELLYSSGGVLEYDPLPGALAVCVHKGIVYVIPSEDPTTIWYSNRLEDGKGPSFSETKVIRIADAFGAGVSLTSDGTYVYLHKAQAIYQLIGEGTDTLGRGSAIVAQLVETGIGTTNPQSVIVTPAGIIFKAAAGFYVKPQGGPSVHIGGQVQAFNGLTITAAVLHPDKNQVRYHTNTNRTLTYNYRYGKWSPWSGAQTATAAVVWGTTPVFANGSTVYKEDTTLFTDNGTAYEEAAATSWLALAGLKGWQYTWTLQGTGERVADHTLQVKVFHDFDDVTPAQTKTQVIGAASKWDWELPIKRGMSASMKVRLSDQASTGAGFKASALTLIYGVMGGAQRVAPSKRMT